MLVHAVADETLIKYDNFYKYPKYIGLIWLQQSK